MTDRCGITYLLYTRITATYCLRLHPHCLQALALGCASHSGHNCRRNRLGTEGRQSKEEEQGCAATDTHQSKVRPTYHITRIWGWAEHVVEIDARIYRHGRHQGKVEQGKARTRKIK